jgi:hypothetical protein
MKKENLPFFLLLWFKEQVFIAKKIIHQGSGKMYSESRGKKHLIPDVIHCL